MILTFSEADFLNRKFFNPVNLAYPIRHFKRSRKHAISSLISPFYHCFIWLSCVPQLMILWMRKILKPLTKSIGKTGNVRFANGFI